MAQRIYCSEHSPDEPMLGTAEVVDVWLLLEYRPVWKGRAIEDGDLSAPLKQWLAGQINALAAMGLKARPQLIRQPEIDRDTSTFMLVTNNRMQTFTGVGYDHLLRLELTEVVRSMRKDPPPGASQPLYLVCTNGQRDLCCARVGLPLYQALRDRVGERVWQVTHLGGHRFAPNVLVIPAGLIYGRVSVDGLENFVKQIDAGELVPQLLRGRSAYPHHVQAAEVFAGISTGLSNLSLADVSGDSNRAEVAFSHDSGWLTVNVGRSDQTLRVLDGCSKDALKEVRPYIRL